MGKHILEIKLTYHTQVVFTLPWIKVWKNWVKYLTFSYLMSSYPSQVLIIQAI